MNNMATQRYAHVIVDIADTQPIIVQVVTSHWLAILVRADRIDDYHRNPDDVRIYRMPIISSIE